MGTRGAVTSQGEKKKVYLTPAELSDRWEGQISEKTLSNWRNDPRAASRGPTYIKISNKVLYPIAAVEEFESQRLYATCRERIAS